MHFTTETRRHGDTRHDMKGNSFVTLSALVPSCQSNIDGALLANLLLIYKKMNNA